MTDCHRPRRFECEDVEVLAARMRALGLDLELLQIRPGRFRAEGLLVPLEHMQLVWLRLDQPLLTMGGKPRGSFALSLSLLPIEPGPVGLKSHGEELSDQTIYGLDPRREVHLVTPGGYGMALLRIDQRILLERAELLGYPDLERSFLRHNWLQLDPLRLGDLRRFLLALFRLAEHQPDRIATLEQRRLWAGDLLPLLLEALLEGVDCRDGLREPSRIDVVKQVQEWARAHPATPVSLEDLCLQVYASRRTLMRGFREHLGMGPMAFLKLRRLHGVHGQLLRHEPGVVRVLDLAADWGFHNAGHFARDYRRQFGELPLHTLRRCSPRA